MSSGSCGVVAQSPPPHDIPHSLIRARKYHPVDEPSDTDTDASCPIEKRRRMNDSSDAIFEGAAVQGDMMDVEETEVATPRHILTFPPEIVIQILSYMNSMDILHLSWVDKDLHNWLVSPSATTIWVHGRNNIPELPACPPDFTERGYARLLFGNVCELCGEDVGELRLDVCWVRVNLCPVCSLEHVISGKDIKKRIPGIDPSILSLVPHKQKPEDPDPMDTRSAVGSHSRSSSESSSGSGSGLGRYGGFARPTGDPSDTTFYFKPAVHALLRQLKECDNLLEMAEFRRARKSLLNEIQKHGRLLESWIHTVSYQAHSKRDPLALRLLGLYQRGVGNMFGHPSHLGKPLGLMKPRQERYTGPDKLRGLPEPRASGPMFERATTPRITWLRSTLADSEYFHPDELRYPPLPVLKEVPSLKPVWERGLGVDDLAAVFEAELPAITEAADNFYAQARADLALKWRRSLASFQHLRSGPESSPKQAPAAGARLSVPEHQPSDDEATALLGLASTVFVCKWACMEPLHYPSLLQHRCVTGPTPFEQPWSMGLDALCVMPYHRAVMLAIIKATGLDLHKATVANLEKFGRRFRWLDGGRQGLAYQTFTWRDAYLTVIELHEAQMGGRIRPPFFTPPPKSLEWCSEEHVKHDLLRPAPIIAMDLAEDA